MFIAKRDRTFKSKIKSDIRHTYRFLLADTKHHPLTVNKHFNCGCQRESPAHIDGYREIESALFKQTNIHTPHTHMHCAVPTSQARESIKAK